MPSLARRGRVPTWTRLARVPWRAFARIVRIVIAAIAVSLGAPPPPPPFLRHEDASAQIVQDEVP